MNQSELEANTCNQRKARENACEQVPIGLSFTSDWSRKWSETFNQSQGKVKQNQSKTQITFDTQLKTALTAPFSPLKRLNFYQLVT